MKQEKCYYRIVATFNSDEPMKYCELTETVCMPYNKIIARVNRYYNKGYDDYGKAEAVTLEMLSKEDINEYRRYNSR